MKAEDIRVAFEQGAYSERNRILEIVGEQMDLAEESGDSKAYSYLEAILEKIGFDHLKIDLAALVKKSEIPQSWYDEDFSGLFAELASEEEK